MDIWMSAFNTTTQALTSLVSQKIPDENQKNYFKEKFNKLIGSIKLFVALDQSMGFTDNNLLDSGLIRGLYRYSNDPDIRRMKDEFQETLSYAADRIIYFYDNRVSNDKPVSLVKDRVNITTKVKEGEKKRFIHSAAFANENNWEGIENYDALITAFPEYKSIFHFFIQLLEKMPLENKIANPQKKYSFGRMLTSTYDSEKEYLHERIKYKIYDYLNSKNKHEDMDRSDFYRFMGDGLDPESNLALHRLFTDRIYNQIVPWEESRFLFAEWDGIQSSPEDVSRIYKETPKSDANTKKQNFISVEQLYSKGKMFNFIASQNLEIVKSIHSTVRSNLLNENPKNAGKIAHDALWRMYQSNQGEQINSPFVEAGIDTISEIADSVMPIKGFRFVTPILKKAYEARQRLVFEFMVLSPLIGKDYKEMIKLFEQILTKSE